MLTEQFHPSDDVQDGKLNLTLVGGVELHFNGQRLGLRKVKAQALLVLLIMETGYRCSRETARGLLWSDSDESAAQTSLRNAIWTLKSVFQKAGFEGFHADRREIWLDANLIRTDIDALTDGADAASLISSLSSIPDLQNSLFPGLDGVSDLFQERLRDYRTFALRKAQQNLKRIGRSSADADTKLEALRLLVGLDPLDEAFARELIQAYRANGQTANALTVYQSLWNALDEAYGQEPSTETQDLIVEIKLASSDPAPKSSPRPCILVQKTRDDHLTPDARDHVSTLRENFCASLVRFREWQIFDAMLMQDGIRLARQPDYALTLSASETADQVNCKVLLAEPRTGELLWSEDFSRPMIDLSDVRGGIISRLAVSLNIHLTAAHQHQNAGSNTQEDVYARWLEAQGLILQFSPESWRAAEDKLDALIQDSPNFSRAFSSRASIENMRQISFPGLYSTPELHAKALGLASQAVQLDPMDSRGQLAMGWSCAMSRQFERAELAFDLAFQYNENDPWTITSSAVGLAFCDHGVAAQKLVNLLQTLDFRLQGTHWSYIAATHFLTGDYQGCIDASEKADEVSHDVPAWHAAALALIGRTDEAAQVAQRFQQIALENWANPSQPAPEDITRWVVSGFPIRNRDTWLAFRDGLRLAGLPVPDLIQSDRIALGYDLPQWD
ncbi:MAG: hypothetical protein GJ676_03845 [Rhodobacteraceae bacterium]|nr:hypothetical protein [Paracoccaceae bacterium]